MNTQTTSPFVLNNPQHEIHPQKVLKCQQCMLNSVWTLFFNIGTLHVATFDKLRPSALELNAGQTDLQTQVKSVQTILALVTSTADISDPTSSRLRFLILLGIRKNSGYKMQQSFIERLIYVCIYFLSHAGMTVMYLRLYCAHKSLETKLSITTPCPLIPYLTSEVENNFVPVSFQSIGELKLWTLL